MSKLKVFEAFAGIGTQHMALKRLKIDFEVVAISEIDKDAIKSYEAIHGKVNNLGDVSKIEPKDIPNHDLFTYSFPCTDISIIGKQLGLTEGSETSSSLLWECKKIIENKMPKYLLMENVKNLVGSKFKQNFDKWLEYLKDLGYSNYWEVLNANDYGIPQNRERVFVVSILNEGEFTFPKKTNLRLNMKDIIEKEVDKKYYSIDESVKFKDLIKNNASKIVCERRYDEGLRFFKGNYIGTLRTINACGDKRVISVDKDGNHFIRRITPLECWRLMGIDDEDFNKVKNTKDSNLYKQAGNAIVVDVLYHIFKELFKIHNESSR